MESFEPVKNETPRHHPEDVSSEENSDVESDNSKIVHSDDEDTNRPDIPGSGPNDMPLFKSASHFAGSFQTGVKGVIADATSFESARRRKQKARAHESTYGGYVPPNVDSNTPLNKSNSNSDVESGDDEDFVRTWRKNRLAELRTGQATTRRQSPSKRKYGRVEAVDAVGYLDAVEKVSPETIVVVTIYNDESNESRFVEDCLFTLSRRYQTTRFVKLHHQEAEMESSVVPAVLAYKGGELFANLIRIVDEIPPGRSLSVDSLELVLRRYV
ncbi:thioredoxin-like protein [Geopyxis carbonaria]|nr:thioredoxin-like protein [Geopyxis carbonaria]